MRAVREIISSLENKIKTNSRLGYQALTQSFTRLRGRIIGTRAGRSARKSPRRIGGRS